MKRKSFSHGIHPPELKQRTADKPIEMMPPPGRLHIPLLQHFGSAAEPLVKKGDAVLLGQKIGEGAALFSASIHASVSGKVLAVENIPHPCGTVVPAVLISNDGQDRKPQKNGSDPFSLSPEEIREKVKEAGVVGLGGAGFPTAVKLKPPADKPIDTVVINGCECEPMLTGDYRLMLEYPEDILSGAELIRRATGAAKILIGLEDNKLEADQAFRRLRHSFPAEVRLLRTKYPQGAEKNLIDALLGRQVPKGKLPFEVGIVVHNVGTAKAIWEAASTEKPLYERVITVSGPGIRNPKNLMVRIGTLFQDIVDFCGGLTDDTDLLIAGGPMMGLSQWSLAIPVIKGTTGLLAMSFPAQRIEKPCIRCARCVDHCPMGLVPTQIMKFARAEIWTEAEAWGAMDCVECGCCQYQCPAKIPLVHWIRLGKNKISGLRKTA